MMNILVLCTGNSCRSQMAHGYLKNLLPDHTMYSAGVETHGINPYAAQVMKEDGIDISGHTSNNVEEYLSIPFDIVITVCDHARESCPIIPGDHKKIHHTFKDPAGAVGTDEEKLLVYRSVRDEIRHFCEEFASELNETNIPG